MSRHPAPEELLLDYAAGTLPEGPALAVALHVVLDPASRRTVDTLSAIGGTLLEGETRDDLAGGFDHAALDRTLAKLDAVPVEAVPASGAPRSDYEWAPAPLRRYLGSNKSWRKAFGGFEGQQGLELHGAAAVLLTLGKRIPRRLFLGRGHFGVEQHDLDLGVLLPAPCFEHAGAKVKQAAGEAAGRCVGKYVDEAHRRFLIMRSASASELATPRRAPTGEYTRNFAPALFTTE